MSATVDPRLVVASTKRGRLYTRKFCHEEAARRHGAGETLYNLAVEYGVTEQAVRYAIQRLDPAKREADNELHRKWRTGVCETCGGAAMRLVAGSKRDANPDGRVLCQSCRSKERRENVALAADGTVLRLWCSTCLKWLPPDRFGRGVQYPDLREGGFHKACRSCLTVMRTEYRNRHKVTCEGGCGRLVEGKGRKGGIERPHLCPQCWHASPAGQAAHAAAREASAARRKASA